MKTNNIENNSVLDASLINNYSLNDQMDPDQSYGFINSSYSLVNHKINRNSSVLADENVKQLVNTFNITDYQNPYMYACRIYENPSGSVQLVNSMSQKNTARHLETTSFMSSISNSDINETNKCKELLSLTPTFLSDNQIVLSDNPNNSSKILQNLLVKFEKFYNDAKI